MERQRPRPESKNMDTCLKRLKQELLSMREAGNGLHAQMNSMMCALQEVKLLQLQTTLERLEISGQHSCACSPNHPVLFSPATSFPSPCPPVEMFPTPACGLKCHHKAPCRSNLRKLPFATNYQIGSVPPSGRFPGESGYSWEHCCSSHSVPTTLIPWGIPSFPGSPQNLSIDGQSLQNDPAESGDDSSDWTSTLMSCGRNRHPLVLGDNVFADLVENWLDLPELERRAPAMTEWEKDEEGEKEPANPMRFSHSQEICQRFSLFGNIFKKLLCYVRPVKDKLLKEKPAWMPLDGPDAEVLKRHKKVAKTKRTFYLPLWSGVNGQLRKDKPDLCPTEENIHISGMYTVTEKVQLMPDNSTAVWV